MTNQVTLDGTVLQAEKLLHAGQIQVAQSLLETVLPQHPNHAKANELMGMIWLQCQDMNKAHAFLETSVQQPDASAFSHYLLGSLYLTQSDYVLAAKHLKQCVNMGTSFFEVLHNLGTALTNTGQLAESIEYLNQATTLRDHADTWHCKGVALTLLTQHDAALVAFRKVIELNDRHTKGWCDLGTSLMINGLKDQAKDAFLNALALSESNEEKTAIHYRLSMLNHEEETPDRAPASFVEDLFDQFSNTFDQTLVEQLQYKAPQVLFELLLSMRADKQWRVLDLGCGTGLFGKLVKAHASQLVGIDLSKGMLEKARLLGLYDALIHADIDSYLAETNEQFDIVAAADVFVYLGRLDEVIAGIRKCLAPQGLLCFSIEWLEHTSEAYKLNASGRYAHSEAYILGLAHANGLTIRRSMVQSVRTEKGSPVPAMVFVLEKTAQ